MAERAYLPADTEAAILILSRRRCAFCHGLNGDQGEKRGQIAHINRNANDNRLENLAFLCLAHHDEYDTRRSQSKGFTVNELRSYRAKLHEFFDDQKSAIEPDDELFTEYRDLIPEKWRHVFQEALSFYTGPHRTQSAVLETLDGAKTVADIAEQIPPHDIAWTATIVEGAIDEGWLQRSALAEGAFESTVKARVLVEALADFPEAVKSAAHRKIWMPDWLAKDLEEESKLDK
jgi:hypothetical protein